MPGTAAATADPASPADLFAANEALAVFMAKRLWSAAQLRGVAFEDLLQDCATALWLAALHFDPGRRVAFSTYACTTIRNYVFSRTLKVRQKDRFAGRMIRLDALDAPAIADAAAVDVGAGLERREDLVEALRYLAGLPQRERRAVLLYFGLAGNRALKMDEVGQRLGLSRSRASQLVAAALTKLRRILGA